MSGFKLHSCPRHSRDDGNLGVKRPNLRGSGIGAFRTSLDSHLRGKDVADVARYRPLFARSQKRQEQTQRANTINAALDEAAVLLGRASAATVGRAQPWLEAELAVNQIRQRLGEGAIDTGTKRRAETLLAKFENADRDRARHYFLFLRCDHATSCALEQEH